MSLNEPEQRCLSQQDFLPALTKPEPLPRWIPFCSEVDLVASLISTAHAREQWAEELDHRSALDTSDWVDHGRDHALQGLAAVNEDMAMTVVPLRACWHS
jgi:hypothetical protein